MMNFKVFKNKEKFAKDLRMFEGSSKDSIYNAILFVRQ